MENKNPAISKSFERASAAFEELKKLSVEEKVRLIKNLRLLLANDIDALAQTICSETGKVKTEALISDIFPCIDALDYYIKNLKKILKPEKIKTPLVFFGSSLKCEYMPSGIALVVSPWNFPFQLAFVPVLSAVLAGCSAILKPSEVAQKTASAIENLFNKAGFPENSVQCVFGGAEIVRELIGAKPSRVLFTGSTKAGKEIGKLCGELLIPAVLELGGKAPAIIFEDADIEKTANGVIYGAFANSGQICVAVTRAIAERTIKDKFLETIVKKAAGLAAGRDYGALMRPERSAHLKELLADAVRKGAKVAYNGNKENGFENPVILDNATKDMRIWDEECFAPVLCVAAFNSESEALELANSVSYGLSASVWSRDIKKAEGLARGIKAGNISINDAVTAAGIAALPFGGLKDSGFGRYHGADGVRFFCDKISFLINNSKGKRGSNRLPYDNALYDDVKNFSSGKKLISSALKLFKRTK